MNLNPFKPKFKITVTFIMKSGKDVVVRCDDINIEKNGNDLAGYSISGAEVGAIFYISLGEVAAIQCVFN